MEEVKCKKFTDFIYFLFLNVISRASVRLLNNNYKVKSLKHRMTDIFPSIGLSGKFLFQVRQWAAIGGCGGECWFFFTDLRMENKCIFLKCANHSGQGVCRSHPTTNLPATQYKRRQQKCLQTRMRTYMFGWLESLELELQVITTADNNVSH